MRCQDIMVTEVETVEPAELAERAWEVMYVKGIHHLVVMKDHTVVGVLSDLDLGGPRGEMLRKDRQVAEMMTSHVVMAQPSTTVRQAANLMLGRSIHCLPV